MITRKDINEMHIKLLTIAIISKSYGFYMEWSSNLLYHLNMTFLTFVYWSCVALFLELCFYFVKRFNWN